VRLDPDQVQALLAAEKATGLAGSKGVMILPLASDGGKLNKSLVELGLAGYSSIGAALTKAGKAERKRLQNE
jgi:hypothetical protein